MVEEKLSWKFPKHKFMIMKIEFFFVFLLALLVLVFAYFDLNQSWMWALVFTLAFLALYLLISYFVQKFRKMEHHYTLTKSKLEIQKKVRNKVKEDKVNLKDVKKHKVDKFFHGGYVLTKQGKKHGLYFNNKKEVEKFDQKFKHNLKLAHKSKKR